MPTPSSAHTRFEELMGRLSVLPHSNARAFEGCSREEIVDLEEYATGKFPPYYRAFLELMGRGSGHLFLGSDALVSENHQLRLRAAAERLLKRRDSTWSLPPSAFVFLMHQGYQFLFIRLDEGEDPPVYLVTEREPCPKKLSDNFSVYIENYTSDLERLGRTNSECFEPF